MEKAVELQFTQEVLIEAAKRFGLVEDSLKKLGSFENYIYEGEKDGIDCILRLTHSSHRSTNMVLGELDWINYLYENGVKVAKAFPSINGKFAEEVVVGEDYFIVSLFEKAEGRLLNRNNPDDLNIEVIMEWGRVIGKMHRLTKDYIPPNNEIKRPKWDEDDLMDFQKYLPETDKEIINIGNELLGYLKTLPMDKDSFGLIHTDIHSGNFFVNEGKITVFDFDDCAYQWFISDIAISLYYTIWWRCNDCSEEEKIIFARYFFDTFMEGYNLENKLDDFWIAEIYSFLKLRDLVLYTVFHKKLDMENIDERYKKLLQDIRARIESRLPIGGLLNGS